MNAQPTAPIDLSYFRLKIAYVALERFRADMDKRYGNQDLRDWDTIQYLDGIDAKMTDADRLERTRLSKARAEATRLADDETISRVIAEGADK